MDEQSIPGGDLHLARLTPEFARFQAILGWRIRQTEQWAPFARLVSLHGWKRVIRAAEQCDPGKRWASDIERQCREYARQEAEAIRQAAQDQEVSAIKAKPKGDWAAVIAKVKGHKP